MMFDLVLHTAGVFAVPYIFYSVLTGHQIVDSVIVILSLVITTGLLVKSIRIFKKAIQFNLGLEAETATGQELNLLMRDGAWVFHDIPYQYGNIDHVIIASGGVFAIETKGISKPTDEERSGRENSTLSVEGDFLVLPHGRTKAPIDQAKIHAKWLRQEIQKRFSLTVRVRAVVAVPGWLVQGSYSSECWVVNPKRGNSLRAEVVKPIVSEEKVNLIASWIEDLSRSVVAKSKEFDPKH